MKISKKYLQKIILEEAQKINEIDSGVMTAVEGWHILEAMLEALEAHDRLRQKDPSIPVQEGFDQTLTAIRSVYEEARREGEAEASRHAPNEPGGVGGGRVKKSTIHDLDIPKMSRMLSMGWNAIQEDMNEQKVAYEEFQKWNEEDFAAQIQGLENVKKAYEGVDTAIKTVAGAAGVKGASAADKVGGGQGAGVMGNPHDDQRPVPKVPDVTLQERKIVEAIKKLNKIIAKRGKKRRR